jgi:hypothetical protein
MKRLACVLGLGIALAAGGCGGGGMEGIPKQFPGTYKVMIASGGKTDADTMSISEGINSTALLDFVYGISQIRALVIVPTKLNIVPQTLHVSHSGGASSDGGAGGAVVYQITGTKI